MTRFDPALGLSALLIVAGFLTMLHGLTLFLRGFRLRNRRTGYIGLFTCSGALSMMVLANLVLDYLGTRKEPEVLILSFGMAFLFVISGGMLTLGGLKKYFKAYKNNENYRQQWSGILDAFVGNAITFVGCMFIDGL